MSDTEQDILNTVIHAVNMNHKLEITYQNGDPRVIWPIEIRAARLLIAWCELRKSWRTFKLSEITSCEELEDTFNPDEIKSLTSVQSSGTL